MLTFGDQVKIINEKILYLQEIYEANLVNISNPQTITSESDYGLDRCYEIKEEIERQIEALNMTKESLTTQE